MTKKILFSALMLVLVFGGIEFMVPQTTNAQIAFPAGCSSALGYSVTNGTPCNGTSQATLPFLQGCTSALGYSIINGVPCDGASVAINFLAGCTSPAGYSTITAAPCNGTTLASGAGVPGGPLVLNVPGLPTTGAGGNASRNIALLIISGIVAAFGVSDLVRYNRALKVRS